MATQLLAHRRQASAQRFISASSPMASQDAAHFRQISAQAPHVAVWTLDPRNIVSALVEQMSAQLAIRPMCSGAACFPPWVRQ